MPLPRPTSLLLATLALLASAGCHASRAARSSDVASDRPTAPAIAGTLGAGFEAGQVVDLGGDDYFIVGVTAENPRTLGVVLMHGRQQLDAQSSGVFGGGEWTCQTSTEISGEAHDGHVFIHVLCANGDETRDERTTTIALRAPAQPPTHVADFTVRWVGPTSWSVDRKTSGCAQGSNGTLELRGDELWLTRKPYMKAQPGQDCVAPPEAEPEVLVDPAR